MKSLALILSYLSEPVRRRNLRVVVWLLVVLVLLVALFSVVFHVLMAREGRDHSAGPPASTGRLTTMSTLGFGDITFESDAGRMFSVVVLLTGALFILVLLPFTFIQFVVRAVDGARGRRRGRRGSCPTTTRATSCSPDSGTIEDALIRRADRSACRTWCWCPTSRRPSPSTTTAIG